LTTTDDQGRPLYCCQDCGIHYLPPADLQYRHGPASQVYCATCQPVHSPHDAARPGMDLADGLVRPRTRAERRAGHAPARRVGNGRGKFT
jgi:hypothetical protein